MKNNHWLLPIDPTPEEKSIAIVGVQNIYDKFCDPMD